MSRSPSGAYLSVRRRGAWTTVQYDRIGSATDLDAGQESTATALVVAACRRHDRPPARRLFLTGPTLVALVVPTCDAEQVVSALLALESGDHEPAGQLTAGYAGQGQA